jgi:competence protein ComEA
VLWKIGSSHANGASAPHGRTAAARDTARPAGDAYAKRIVEGRPYKRKDELVQKKVVPQGTYDRVKDQVVAKRQ